MKQKPNPEFDAFTNLVDRVLAVPHTEIQQREQKYQKRVALKPKRGPKPKVKASVSRDVGEV